MIVEQYLKLTEELVSKYGADSIVLMQVGSFFEMYGLREEPNSELVGSRIADAARHCDLLIAKKSQNLVPKAPLPRKQHSVYMAGFGVAQLDKYMRRLSNGGYSVAVYDQNEHPSGDISRTLREIVSPGTFVQGEEVQLANSVLCVVLAKEGHSALTASVAVFDMVTGDSRLEIIGNGCSDEASVMDRIDRVIAIAAPIEAIVQSQDITLDDLMAKCKVLGLANRKLHVVGKDSSEERKADLRSASKQIRQAEVLCKAYSKMTPETVAGMMRETGNDLTGLVLLLEFVREHNPDLLGGLDEPELRHESGVLQMATHSLSQLNILPTPSASGKFSSVTELMDCTITRQGSRLLRERLYRPLTNVDQIRERLKYVDAWRKQGSWEELRASLDGIGDFMRVQRMCCTNKLTADHMAKLAMWTTRTKHLIHDYSSKGQIGLDWGRAKCWVEQLEMKVTGIFNTEKCIGLPAPTVDRLSRLSGEGLLIFKSGTCEVIDGYSSSLEEESETIHNILSLCNSILDKAGERKAKNKNVRTFCTLVEKDGPYISGTKRRLELVCAALKTKDKYMHSDITVTNLPGSRSQFVLVSKQLNSMRGKIRDAHTKMAGAVWRKWTDVVGTLKGLAPTVKKITDLVATCDVIQNSCYVAERYGYCAPNIVHRPTGTVTAKALRHPLVEQINMQELYVANDISLDSKKNVMLLYGTNAVGKSSLIKALGIAVCLAQAGMYVPCQSFEISPYQALFTRILGNDDLFRGLSTFAVEMSELRTILVNGDSRSLVIGDELCSGTETSSATSIFAASLEALHNQGTSAVFATHFHEVAKYDEINALDKVKVVHMAVVYDKASRRLVYDRKLRSGPGNSMYGLEVCKSLSLPDTMLKRAHELRKKYSPATADDFSLQSSRYSKRRLKSKCEMCGKASTEVHHLIHQSLATDGKIGQYSVNHAANLINVCHGCHDKFHAADGVHRRVKCVGGGSTVVAEPLTSGLVG